MELTTEEMGDLLGSINVDAENGNIIRCTLTRGSHEKFGFTINSDFRKKMFVVSNVEFNSIASRAGLKPTMIILSINDKDVKSMTPGIYNQMLREASISFSVVNAPVVDIAPVVGNAPVTEKISRHNDLDEIFRNFKTRLFADEVVIKEFKNCIVTSERLLIRQPLPLLQAYCGCRWCPVDMVSSNVFLKDISSVAFQYKGVPLELALVLLSAASTCIYEGFANDNIFFFFAAVCFGILLYQITYRKVYVSVGCTTTGGLSWGTPDPFQIVTNTMDADDLIECVLLQKRRALNESMNHYVERHC